MHNIKLPNGLKVLTIPLQDTRAVTVFVFAKVGSRYESRRTNGISHFIEHLMFKGTTKRPSTLQISKLLDGVGAAYNAFTSKDWTGYYVKINHEHTNLALDIVSDMLQHSLFHPKEIERERGVIIEEINMYDDNPVMAIDDLFESTVFGGHHPLGWNIAGPREVIRSVSRNTLLKFRNDHYHARNMLMVVAGKLNPELNTQIRQYFGGLRSKPRVITPSPYRVAAGKTMRLKWKELEQVQLAVGTRAFGYTDRRMPALTLLSTLLGGNMSSRLFIQVRERRGLAYSVHTGLSPYTDTGSFVVQAGLEKTRVPEALRVILAELKKLTQTKVTSAELKRTKEYVRGKMILELEDSDAIASWYGRQGLFYKKILTPDEAMKKVMAVTAADVQRVAQLLFRPRNYRLAIIGPFKEPAPFEKILRAR